MSREQVSTATCARRRIRLGTTFGALGVGDTRASTSWHRTGEVSLLSGSEPPAAPSGRRGTRADLVRRERVLATRFGPAVLELEDAPWLRDDDPVLRQLDVSQGEELVCLACGDRLACRNCSFRDEEAAAARDRDALLCLVDELVRALRAERAESTRLRRGILSDPDAIAAQTWRLRALEERARTYLRREEARHP